MAQSVANIRPGRLEEVSEIADCHMQSFPETSSTQMGRRWIEYLYSYYIHSPDGITLVAIGKKDTVVGVVIGGEPHIAMKYRRASIRKFPALLVYKTILNSTIRTSAIAGARALLKRKQKPSASAAPIPTNYAVLLSIGVNPCERGAGTASSLVEQFEQECWKRGFSSIRLGVRKENTRARRFYDKSGWALCESQSSFALQYACQNPESESPK